MSKELIPYQSNRCCPNEPAISFYSIVGIGAVDKPTRVKPPDQTIVDNVFKVDVSKAWFSDFGEPLDVFHAFQRRVGLAVQAGENFLVAFFERRGLGKTQPLRQGF